MLYQAHVLCLCVSPYTQIEDELTRTHGRRTISPNVMVGLFLVQEGAELHIKNKDGFSPLEVRPPDIGILLTDYATHKR